MKVRFVLEDGAFAPEKAHEADAGFDLRMPKNLPGMVIYPKGELTIDTGVHVEIPEGYVGFLKSKSGLNVKHGIVSEGVIDSGYTGTIRVKLYCNAPTSEGRYAFIPGDKITQLVILPIPDVEMEQVDSLEDTERGDGGFGSSGR